MIKPSPKLLVAAGVLVVAVAVLFTFTIMAALDQRDKPAAAPQLNVTVGDVRLEVAPWDNCREDGRCEVSACPTKLAVPTGKAIVISAPQSIYRLPWALTVQRFNTHTGQYETEEIPPRAEATPATFVLKSTPDLLLANVELQQLAIAKDSFGQPDLATRYRWCVDTRVYDHAG